VAPITRAGLGWLLIVFDLRLGGYDVVVDAAGWLVVLLSMQALRSKNGWFTWAARSAGIALVLSLGEYVPELPGEVVATSVYNLAFTAAFFCQASGMTACAREGGADSIATQTNVLRWSVLALNVAGILLIVAFLSGQESRTTLASVVFLSLLCFVWFTALQLLAGNGRTSRRTSPGRAEVRRGRR